MTIHHKIFSVLMIAVVAVNVFTSINSGFATIFDNVKVSASTISNTADVNTVTYDPTMSNNTATVVDYLCYSPDALVYVTATTEYNEQHLQLD